MEEGRKKTYPTKNVVDIAILDTGVDLSHPHLKGKIASMDCMDFVNDTPEICDDVGHGTHTASLLIKTATTARVCCGRVFSERKADDETIDIIAKVGLIEHVSKINDTEQFSTGNQTCCRQMECPNHHHVFCPIRHGKQPQD